MNLVKRLSKCKVDFKLSLLLLKKEELKVEDNPHSTNQKINNIPTWYSNKAPTRLESQRQYLAYLVEPKESSSIKDRLPSQLQLLQDSLKNHYLQLVMSRANPQTLSQVLLTILSHTRFLRSTQKNFDLTANLNLKSISIKMLALGLIRKLPVRQSHHSTLKCKSCNILMVKHKL